MTSLTPLDKKDGVVDEAMQEGLLNGLFTLIPSTAAVYALVKQSPAFAMRTNLQSRTALSIMPALFVVALTAEEKVVHSMRTMAKENQHSHDSVHWAERQLMTPPSSTTTTNVPNTEQQQELHALYKRAVYESGVRVVPGDTLAFHHVMSNYVAENPFKVLASLAVPGFAWIFYGRSGQQHLTMSMKIMHTRVFGQFATISALLGVMGFKSMMDNQGKFITEAQADARVQEMQDLRLQMLHRLEATSAAQQAYQKAIQEAHDEDVKAGNETKHKKAHHHHHHHHHKKKKHDDSEEPSAVMAAPEVVESTTLALSPKKE